MNKVESLANDLRGTCKSPDDLVDDFDDWTQEELQQLDEEVLQCTCCSWWVDSSETLEDKNGEVVCEDCDDLSEVEN